MKSSCAPEDETFPEEISTIVGLHANAMKAFFHGPEYWKGVQAAEPCLTSKCAILTLMRRISDRMGLAQNCGSERKNFKRKGYSL